jgi:hypothetical protein
MYPYSTTGNGNHNTILSLTNGSLKTGDTIDLATTGGGTSVEVVEKGIDWYSHSGLPTVSTPRFNFTQGEVHVSSG